MPPQTERVLHHSVVLVPKTCSRCGRSFEAAGRNNTCTACKKIKADLAAAAPPKLSFREKQIVRLIQLAKSNKEIAYELCLTEGTVKQYVYSIFRKTGVTNRTELALWGREAEVNVLAVRSGSAPAVITTREDMILTLVRRGGLSNKEIAGELGLTLGSVKETLFHIFAKLGVNNRTELALWARSYEVKATRIRNLPPGPRTA